MKKDLVCSSNTFIAMTRTTVHILSLMYKLTDNIVTQNWKYIYLSTYIDIVHVINLIQWIRMSDNNCLYYYFTIEIAVPIRMYICTVVVGNAFHEQQATAFLHYQPPNQPPPTPSCPVNSTTGTTCKKKKKKNVSSLHFDFSISRFHHTLRRSRSISVWKVPPL